MMTRTIKHSLNIPLKLGDTFNVILTIDSMGNIVNMETPSGLLSPADPLAAHDTLQKELLRATYGADAYLIQAEMEMLPHRIKIMTTALPAHMIEWQFSELLPSPPPLYLLLLAKAIVSELRNDAHLYGNAHEAIKPYLGVDNCNILLALAFANHQSSHMMLENVTEIRYNGVDYNYYAAPSYYTHLYKILDNPLFGNPNPIHLSPKKDNKDHQEFIKACLLACFIKAYEQSDYRNDAAHIMRRYCGAIDSFNLLYGEHNKDMALSAFERVQPQKDGNKKRHKNPKFAESIYRFAVRHLLCYFQYTYLSSHDVLPHYENTQMLVMACKDLPEYHGQAANIMLLLILKLQIQAFRDAGNKNLTNTNANLLFNYVQALRYFDDENSSRLKSLPQDLKNYFIKHCL